MKPAVVDADWNELVVARLCDGETSVWKAWRRSIAAFADPRVWSNPETWAEHFERQPNAAWGFAGYGLIAVDMDHRMSISMNDYSVPGSIHLPMDSLGQDPKEQSGLRALLDQPQHWACARFQLATTPWVGKGKSTWLTLDDIVDRNQTPRDRWEAVTVRRGVLSVRGKPHTLLRGSLDLPGWTNHNDRGQEDPDFTLRMMSLMRENGFAAPDGPSLTERVERALEDHGASASRAARARLHILQTTWPEAGSHQPAPTKRVVC